jgi:small-conductance mechanosensitive channel
VLRASTPSPTPTPNFEEIIPERAPCVGEESSTLYCRVLDLTGHEWLAASSDWLIAKPLAILLILLVAVLARAVLHRLIIRLSRRAAEGTVPGVLQRGHRSFLHGANPLLSERRKQRAETMGSVLKSVATGVVFTLAGLMVLSELGVNIAPIIASAGILGVALGFGAQSLVKDFLSGIFMILEDQYGVGDVIDVGEATGAVEAVGLRVTRLRDIDGTVWYFPNGAIPRVGNQSQGWARAVVDVSVAYGEDVRRVRDVLQHVARDLDADEEFGPLILEEPEVWGVEALSNDAVLVRVVLKTVPLEQWRVAREYRERVKTAFDARGIEIPFPQRAVWIRTEAGHAEGREPEGDGTFTA